MSCSSVGYPERRRLHTVRDAVAPGLKVSAPMYNETLMRGTYRDGFNLISMVEKVKIFCRRDRLWDRTGKPSLLLRL